jgi:CDP-paratose 2-epimerase
MAKTLITGGAGFIGANAAKRFMEKGHTVVVLDNLSRKGTPENLAWLQQQGPVVFEKYDIRDEAGMNEVFARHKDVTNVLHLAGQVAVTTSVTNPREDFEINALGTFNILEAIRLLGIKPTLLYSSTNKVYGGMEDVVTHEVNGRYEYRDFPNGVREDVQLDFHSPYGCSKGAAEQYVRDYCRIYDIPTVVFRQSCIYGQRQMGMEDQGWVAWFVICCVMDKGLSIYGDGKQVRDALFVQDLVNAYEMAIENISKTRGQMYNVGGGPSNKLSLLELIAYLEEFSGKKMQYRFDAWRPGDQPVFVCDIDKAKREFGWEPKTSLREGIHMLYDWVCANEELFAKILGIKRAGSA